MVDGGGSVVTRASKASWAASKASDFADKAFFSASEQASTSASAMTAASVTSSSSLDRSAISDCNSSTLVLNSEQVYVVVLMKISLLILVFVRVAIFSRTLSTFPETSETLSAVDWPSVVIEEDPGEDWEDPGEAEEDPKEV